MTKHRRQPLTLRAHDNVYPLIDIAERRRATEQPALFIGFSTREPENVAPAAPEARQRANWLRAFLGRTRRSRPS